MSASLLDEMSRLSISSYYLIACDMRVGSYTLLPVAVDVVGFCLFLYIAPFVICTSLGLSGGAFLVFLLL